MGKHTIRITSAGIYGAPTAENPSGELPVGFEFKTDADLPAGWIGRAVVVGQEPKDGSVFVTGNGDDDDSDVGKARREVIEKAQAEFDRLAAEHAGELHAVTARADKAEADLQHANEQLAALNEKLKAFDRDGSGSAEVATAADITTAIGLLDKTKDAHWTKAGLPAVEAVAELTGKTVSREAIESAAPDAKRPE